MVSDPENAAHPWCMGRKIVGSDTIKGERVEVVVKPEIVDLVTWLTRERAKRAQLAWELVCGAND